MTVRRLLPRREPEDTGSAVPFSEWLDDKENERDVLIMRLRHVERLLIKNGRLKVESLPKRIK